MNCVFQDYIVSPEDYQTLSSLLLHNPQTVNTNLWRKPWEGLSSVGVGITKVQVQRVEFTIPAVSSRQGGVQGKNVERVNREQYVVVVRSAKKHRYSSQRRCDLLKCTYSDSEQILSCCSNSDLQTRLKS